MGIKYLLKPGMSSIIFLGIPASFCMLCQSGGGKLIFYKLSNQTNVCKRRKKTALTKIKDYSLPYPYSLLMLRKLACLDIVSAVQLCKYPK
jgi:hypothetical protein